MPYNFIADGFNIEAEYKETDEQVVKHLLSKNVHNRPLNGGHIKRIEKQLLTNRWMFNGNTVKLDWEGNLIDGQNRLFAMQRTGIYKPILLIKGLPRACFSTLDTIQRGRSGGDMLSILGTKGDRTSISGGLAWLVRYRANPIFDSGTSHNIVEVSEIEEAFVNHMDFAEAVKKTKPCINIISISQISFLYYIMAEKNQAIADKFLSVMINPVDLALGDPFLAFRRWLFKSQIKTSSKKQMPRDPIMTFALAIKAANLVAAGRQIGNLQWRDTGVKPEPFPVLNIAAVQLAEAAE